MMEMKMESHKSMKSMSIKSLLLMAVIHFVLMYILMYAMVDSFSNIFPNLNQFYMAGIMTAPMLITETLLMGSMYDNQRAVRIVMGLSLVVLIVFFAFIRLQTGINDREFLRSMIPHHGGAVLMCQQATIQDSEIQELCDDIIASQQAEIEQMKTILDRLE
jgi:uncharacterized protein (DUF305 family)